VQFVTGVSCGFADRFIVARGGHWERLCGQNICLQGAGAIERPLRGFLARQKAAVKL